MDPGASISELHARLIEFRDRRDWRKFHTPRNLAMSVSIESAELLELFQWKSDGDIENAKADNDFVAAAGDEIADVLIYLVACGGTRHRSDRRSAKQDCPKREKVSAGRGTEGWGVKPDECGC